MLDSARKRGCVQQCVYMLPRFTHGYLPWLAGQTIKLQLYTWCSSSMHVSWWVPAMVHRAMICDSPRSNTCLHHSGHGDSMFRSPQSGCILQIKKKKRYGIDSKLQNVFHICLTAVSDRNIPSVVTHLPEHLLLFDNNLIQEFVCVCVCVCVCVLLVKTKQITTPSGNDKSINISPPRTHQSAMLYYTTRDITDKKMSDQSKDIDIVNGKQTSNKQVF